MNGVAVMISVLIIIILVITILIIINSCKDKFTDNDDTCTSGDCYNRQCTSNDISNCCTSFCQPPSGGQGAKLVSDPYCQNSKCGYNTYKPYCPAESYPEGPTYDPASHACCGDYAIYSTGESQCINGKVYGNNYKLCKASDGEEMPYLTSDWYCTIDYSGYVDLKPTKHCQTEARYGCDNNKIYCSSYPSEYCGACGYCYEGESCDTNIKQSNLNNCIGKQGMPSHDYIFSLYENN